MASHPHVRHVPGARALPHDRSSRGLDALGAVLAHLRCPICHTPFRPVPGSLECRRGHCFDRARQGYVNLSGGRGPNTADTASMVAARERFLATGHYAPIADVLREEAARADPEAGGIVVDLGGGTGYFLSHVLDALPARHGVCIDLSAPALRRAARAHPRGAAIGSDVWARLPLADACAHVVVSVFGPRNLAEIRRVLAPGGVLVVAVPTRRHLGELVTPLGMLTVGPGKSRRLRAGLSGLDHVGGLPLTYPVRLSRSEITDLAGMGPTARHVPSEVLAHRVRALPGTSTVTVSVRVNTFRAPRSIT